MNCLICNSVNIDLIINNNYTECKNCEIVYQNNRDNRIKYDLNYISLYEKLHTTRMMSLLRSGFVLGLSNFTKDKSILDIGYGNGDFLRVMAMDDWSIYGNDIHGVDLGIKNLCLDEIKDVKFNVITCFDSLEHFPDPSFVRNLKYDYLIISCPLKPKNNKDLPSWKHFKPNEHLFHFNKKSLSYLLQKDIYLSSCFEDIIRSDKFNKPNILTVVFKG